jgi:hypothetical protein
MEIGERDTRMIEARLWDLYYQEIIKVKEEYDRSLKPILNDLENLRKSAWNQYLRGIAEAEKILKEE